MKILALHLPQYHEIPENNAWRGKGFTERTNIRKAKHYFPGHHQPREPLNDNYYDLSNVDDLIRQCETAKKYGIDGFCFYHYWFDGKQLLEKPCELLLENKGIDIEYCFSRANEPWTRSRDGKERDVIMPQHYDNSDDRQRHIDYLLPFFKDKRYIKVDNKPMFVIYRSSSIPRIDQKMKLRITVCKEHGFDGLHIVETLNSFQSAPVSKLSDASMEFEPLYKPNLTFVNLLKKIFLRFVLSPYQEKRASINNRPYRRYGSQKDTYLGAFVGWDTTPRKGKKGSVLRGFSLSRFKKGFGKQLEKAKKYNSEFLFVNAWNERCEGTYLEPDKLYGYKVLEIIHELRKKLSL